MQNITNTSNTTIYVASRLWLSEVLKGYHHEFIIVTQLFFTTKCNAIWVARRVFHGKQWTLILPVHLVLIPVFLVASEQIIYSFIVICILYFVIQCFMLCCRTFYWICLFLDVGITFIILAALYLYIISTITLMLWVL